MTAEGGKEKGENEGLEGRKNDEVWVCGVTVARECGWR